MTLSLRAAGLAIVAALLLPALPAHAERADRDKPFVLEAGNVSYGNLKQVYYLTDNVTLTKGTIVLRSDQTDLRADPEDCNYIVTTSKPGNLAFIRQKRDNIDEYIQGRGERIEYDDKQRISRLITRTRMERFQGTTQLDEIRGAVITCNDQREFYTAPGGVENATTANPSDRVRAVLTSRTNVPAAPISAPAAKP